MTPTDQHEPELGGDEALAAEYVLGVLPASERQEVARRLEADAGFARLVDRWEAHFSPLGQAYEAVEAPASVKQAIDRRIFASATPAQQPSLWGSLALWRGLAAACVVALAIMTVWAMQPPAEQPAAPRMVASLESDETDVRYLAFYDEAAGTIHLSHVAGSAAPDRDFELWVIEGNEPPASLGVIAAGDRFDIRPDDTLQAKLAAGAVLAVSLEPGGGSPTGQPTGPVVAAGDLRSI
ncbi:anti-sigma factor [Aliihoeflea sp. PC F10.4]